MQERELAWEAALRGVTAEAVRELYIADTPLRRLETPEDVATVVAFLLGPDAAFIIRRGGGGERGLVHGLMSASARSAASATWLDGASDPPESQRRALGVRRRRPRGALRRSGPWTGG